MNKVQTGDPIQIRASTWNSFIDAAEYVKNLQADQSGGVLKNGVHNGVVLLKNEEGILFSRFSAMVITDVLIRPDANEMEFAGKCPAFIGRKMRMHTRGILMRCFWSPSTQEKSAMLFCLG